MLNDDILIHLSSEEAEDLTLGAVLMYPEKIEEVFIKEQFLYSRINQCILGAMFDVHEKGYKIEVPIILDYVTKNGNLDPGNVYNKLKSMVSQTFTTSNFIHHQNKIIEMYKKREQIKIIQQVQHDILNMDTRDVHEKLVTRLTYLNEISANDEDDGHISKVMQDTFEIMQGTNEGLYAKTHFTDLDRILNGLKRQDLVIIGARPSMGKTAFAMDIAKNHAIKNDGPTAVFSIEMPNTGLATRMISNEGNIDSYNLKHAEDRLSSDDWTKVMGAMGRIGNTKMHMFDDSTVTTDFIRRKSRMIKAKYPDEHLVIFIDYLQLIQGSDKHRGNRTQEISEISRDLKRIARELDATVVALSQLSRTLEQRQDKRPMMSDLRESGAIEQDADVITFLYRDDYYDRESESKNITEVIIAKHRDGGIGTVSLGFKKEFSKFVNIDWSQYKNN